LAETFVTFTFLAPEVFAAESERTPYVRHNTTCAGEPSKCFTPLVTGCPGGEEPCPSLLEENADVPAGTRFGGKESQELGDVNFVGATPDAEHVLVSSENVALGQPPHPGENANLYLYEWSAASPAPNRLEPVGILPEEKLAKEAYLGYKDVLARGAVSRDGSMVFWSDGLETGEHLYLRDMKLKKTIRLDVPEQECVVGKTCGEGQVLPVFQAASEDGSRVFFTDWQRLTANAGEIPQKPDLYVCDITISENIPVCKLTDLTPAPGAGKAADVQGVVIGASRDGSWVYFVANGALAAGAPSGDCHETSGSVFASGAVCGLYVVHRGETGWGAPRLVAVIGNEDDPDWGGASGLGGLTARVSANGRFLVFMSDRSLTGYDNHDAVTGTPDQEVFSYDAQANGGTGRLVCVSCNPSGARPEGVTFERLEFGGLVGLKAANWSREQGIAGSVPGWTPINLRWARYQSRYLSDQGRVFFNSTDALVRRYSKGPEDVDAYEPANTVAEPPPNDSCTTASPSYSPVSGGCVTLVSSGASSDESGFLDASENGSDVFFLTSERLAAPDTDTSFDVYDAHVCTSEWACPAYPPPAAACTTADSCRAARTPPPEAFGAPASATFMGPGNVVASTPGGGVVTPKAFTSAQRLARALKACRRVRKRSRRVKCEVSARRRYGAAKRSSVSTKRGR
jgi:hypothetical protein